MKRWLAKVLAHFGHGRLSPDERARLRRERRVLSEADRVIEEYRKLDGALRVYVQRPPR